MSLYEASDEGSRVPLDQVGFRASGFRAWDPRLSVFFRGFGLRVWGRGSGFLKRKPSLNPKL